MAASSGTVHALVDVVFPDGLSVGLTGMLCSTVTVDYSAFQCGISSQGVFQCLDTQICFHITDEDGTAYSFTADPEVIEL